MKTQQVLRVTETGSVEYNPAYPVSDIGTNSWNSKEYRKREEEYQQAVNHEESNKMAR